MNEGPLQFTLRRWQGALFSPRFWGMFLTVGAIIGVIGPFGTFDELSLVPRLGYWLALVFITFMTGYTVIGLVIAYVLGSRWPHGLRLAVAGAMAGLPVTAVVVLFNGLLHGELESPAGIVRLAVECCSIAAAISFLFGLVDGYQADGGTAAAGDAGTAPAAVPEPGIRRPRILDRLPPNLRGRLSHLSVQDHYVDVRTDKGGTLVLMRLADAIAETEGVAGLQIHRSHWVALEGIEKAVRRDGRLLLRMRDGTELPVSRTFAPAVREAGFA